MGYAIFRNDGVSFIRVRNIRHKITTFTRDKGVYVLTGGGDTYTIPTDKLIAEYGFNGDYTDSINDYDGTGVNTNFISGIDEEAVQINGITQRIEINSLASFFSGRKPFTVSSMVYWEPGVVGWVLISTSGKSTGYYGLYLYIGSDGSINIQRGIEDSYYNACTTTAGVAISNSWNSCVFMYDGNKMYVVLNGDKAKAELAESTSLDGLQYCTLGAGWYQNNIYYRSTNLRLDQMRIYEKCLSESEYMELYYEFNKLFNTPRRVNI